jgi:signal transduction histidine kinase
MALIEAGRQKDNFLAMLGHELRTPLSTMQNTLGVMERREGSESGRQRERLARQVQRMAGLIDEMQDLSRMSRGKLLLHRERLDLARLVKETAEDQRASFEQRNVALTLELSPSEMPLWLTGDAARLAQMLTNLLDNALKFTDPGGQVTVTLGLSEGSELPQRHRDTEREAGLAGEGAKREEATGEGVKGRSGSGSLQTGSPPYSSSPHSLASSSSVSLCLCGEKPSAAMLSVSDTGIGIEPELLPRVFESFTQAEHRLERSRGGLGLGLALVKGLVEAHGGSVTVTSPGVGQGTQVTICLPLEGGS